MRPRILVIDDEKPIRGMLREAFEPDGYEVIGAQDGLAAMNIYQQTPVDLIITDIFMPRRDGLAVIDQVSKEHPDIKIIAMSASRPDRPKGALEKAMKLGADCTFPKPFSIAAMMQAVKRLIG